MSHSFEVRRARWLKYYANNRERMLAQRAAYEQAHRSEMAAKSRRHYAANIAEERTRARAYRVTHQDLKAHHGAVYRARKIGNGGSHTLDEWRAKCALLGNVCTYCGESRSLERDHKVPLSRGGTDDITNIVPACRSCNSKKHDKGVREFLAVAA